MKIFILGALDQKVTRSEIKIACSLGIQSGNRLGRFDQYEFEVGRLELLSALAQHRTRNGRDFFMGSLSASRGCSRRPEANNNATEWGCTNHQSILISHRSVLPKMRMKCHLLTNCTGNLLKA